MLELNGQRCLNQSIMQQFVKANEPTDLVLITCQTFESTLTVSELHDFFLKQEHQLPENEELMIATENAVLSILGIDYNWWNTTRRINKLFDSSEPTKKLKVKAAEEPEVQTIAKICYYENDAVTEELSFSGSKKQCVEWLNKNYQLYSIKAFFKKPIRFSIDNSEWKTVDDFVKEGRFVL